jgi:hypothetical protein
MVRVAGLVLALAGPAAAGAAGEGDAAGRIGIELNRLDAEAAACRLTFVADNRLAPLTALVLETVLFDHDGRVAALTLFDFGVLPEGRRRVRQFDVGGVDCGEIGAVLVNGVSGCAGEGLDAEACAAALAVSGTVAGVEVMQ